MLIQQASAPETGGGFLHAGYLSASGNYRFSDMGYVEESSTIVADSEWVHSGFVGPVQPAATTTYVARVPPQQAMAQDAPVDFNMPMLVLVGAGLVLVKLDKKTPAARRGLTAIVIGALGLAGLLMPALLGFSG